MDNATTNVTTVLAVNQIYVHNVHKIELILLNVIVQMELMMMVKIVNASYATKNAVIVLVNQVIA